jgi:ABC-type branched-subunit amino acid transport system ATPase component
MSLLEVSNIVAGYGETEILHRISIAVEENHIITIIGPNGSGKSTLLKSIFGLVKPSKGQVVFQGKNITGLAPEAVVRRGLCYVPQSSNVFSSLSINENLEMGAFIRKDDFRQRLDEVYGLFPDLAGREHYPEASGRCLHWLERLCWTPLYCCWTSRLPGLPQTWSALCLRRYWV